MATPLLTVNHQVRVFNPDGTDQKASVAALSQAGTSVGSAGAVSGVTLAGSCGNINTQVSAAGVNSVAAAQDTVLMTAAIPAGAWDVAGRIVTINAAGKFGATVANKTLKLYFGTDLQTVGAAIVGAGSTTITIASSGVQTTNGGGWFASAQVVKYGAAGSNTQLGINTGMQAGTSHLGTTAPVNLTANEALITYVTLTGTTPTNATDISAQWFELFWDN